MVALLATNWDLSTKESCGRPKAGKSRSTLLRLNPTHGASTTHGGRSSQTFLSFPLLKASNNYAWEGYSCKANSIITAHISSARLSYSYAFCFESQISHYRISTTDLNCVLRVHHMQKSCGKDENQIMEELLVHRVTPSLPFTRNQFFWSVNHNERTQKKASLHQIICLHICMLRDKSSSSRTGLKSYY